MRHNANVKKCKCSKMQMRHKAIKQNANATKCICNKNANEKKFKNIMQTGQNAN